MDSKIKYCVNGSIHRLTYDELVAIRALLDMQSLYNKKKIHIILKHKNSRINIPIVQPNIINLK